MALVSSILAAAFLFGGILQMEKLKVLENMERAVSVMRYTIDGLESTALDWASWDETYDFALGKNPAYIEENFMIETFSNLHIRFMAIADTAGKILYAGVHNVARDELETPTNLLLENWRSFFLRSAGTSDNVVSGLFMAEGAPVLLVASPILKSSGEGPRAGTLLIAKSLDEPMMAEFSRLVQLPISYSLVGGGGSDLDAKEWARVEKALKLETTAVIPLSQKTIASYRFMNDIWGTPAVLIEVEEPRSFYLLGLSQIIFFYLFLFVMMGGLYILNLWSLKKAVLDPMLSLERALVKKKELGDLRGNLSTAGDDELASFAVSINGLLDEVRELKTRLEERVYLRTKELEDSNRELDYTNQELETFAYSISHDLRTPLRGIHGYSELLLAEPSGSPPETRRHYLERIQLAAQKMSRLIDGLLLLTKINHMQLAKANVNLGLIARDYAEKQKEYFKGRMFEFNIAEPLFAEGDPLLLEALIQNLLENAIKFTSDNDVARITFDAEEGMDGLVFFVKDDGAGFDEAYGDSLFIPFHRLHGDTIEGIGIGLAIAKHIVAKHGGRIWAESSPGQGATFYFTLGSSTKSEPSLLAPDASPSDDII